MLFRNEVHVQQKMLPVEEDFVFQTGFNKDVLCKKALLYRRYYLRKIRLKTLPEQNSTSEGLNEMF